MMSPPKFPGTGVEIPPRPMAHSESEVTPRTEYVLGRVREAEEHRVADITQVNLRLAKVEKVVDRMELHLDAAEDRERAKERRAKRTKWLVTAIGAPVLVAVIGSGAAAWTQVLVQSRATAKAAATQTTDDKLPSLRDAYKQGFSDGSKATVDEQLARLQANPAPLQRGPDLVAARAQRR